jgi:CcmD family protein
VSEWSYIVAAYALTWLALLGYALRLASRLRRSAAALKRAEPSNGVENER